MTTLFALGLRRAGHVAAGLTLAVCCVAPADAGLLDGAPREAVSTGITDAVAVSPSLALHVNGLKPAPWKSLSFPPGYFRVRLQSYCLHAGTYAPTKGEQKMQTKAPATNPTRNEPARN